MAGAHHYHARLVWIGAEQGPTRDYAGYARTWRVQIAGKPDLTGSADPVFRGDPALHNPEDLLVAALATCHMLSYLALCARAGIVVSGYEDEASGVMAAREGVVRFTEVVLRPHVTIADGDLEAARALHASAHAACFIAKSVAFPVRNDPRIVEASIDPAP